MYAVGALIGLMVLLWGAAIWASFSDEPEQTAQAPRPRLRKVA